MNKFNYKQKAIEFSIGIVIGFFVLSMLFNNFFIRLSSNINGNLEKNNQYINKNIDKLDTVIKTNNDIIMKQEFMIDKIFQLEYEINNANKKLNILHNKISYRP